jgi:LDH2 family malate/lactate/ureidoglycolate dehydrogenase
VRKAVKSQERKRVQTPGEPEWETKFQRFEDGIPLPDETWGNIMNLTNGWGIEVEE